MIKNSVTLIIILLYFFNFSISSFTPINYQPFPEPNFVFNDIQDTSIVSISQTENLLFGGNVIISSCCPPMFMILHSNKMWNFNTTDFSWTLINDPASYAVDYQRTNYTFPFPGCKNKHIGFLLNDKSDYYIFGGDTFLSAEYGWTMEPLNDVWLYDVKENVYSFIMGNTSQDVWSSSFVEGKMYPGSRLGMVGGTINDNSFFIWGGMLRIIENSEYKMFQEMWLFNSTIQNWLYIEPSQDSVNIPTALFHGTSWMVSDTHFYYFGGEKKVSTSQGELFHDLYVFNFNDKRWVHLAGSLLPNPVTDLVNMIPGGASSGIGLRIGDNTIGLYGGDGFNENVIASECLNFFWIFDIPNSLWILKEIDDYPQCNFLASTFEISVTETYVFAGIENDKMFKFTISCYNYSMNDPLACSLNGICVGYDKCQCMNNFVGSYCLESIKSATLYTGEKKIIVEYEVPDFLMEFGFSCSQVVKEIHPLGSQPLCSFENNKTLAITLGDYSYVDKHSDQIVLLALSNGEEVTLDLSVVKKLRKEMIIGIAFGSAALLLFLIAYCFSFLIICICCNVKKLKKKQKKFEEIGDDLDIIVAEKRMERDTSKPHFKLKNDFFKIDVKKVNLIKKIKSGAEGIVYKAKYQGNYVAFKSFRILDVITNNSDYTSFEKELTLMSSLNFPTIINFFGACLLPPRIGLVMEYAANGDLVDYLTKNKKNISFHQKLKILIDVSSAISFLHSKGIIHRDVKCNNILLCDRLVAKLMDFGISRLVGEEHTSKLTRRIGTGYYMAPEIILSSHYSKPIDVFSFSIVMWELLHELINPYIFNNPLEETMIEIRVANENLRPTIEKKFQRIPKLKFYLDLMVRCWSDDISKRPTIEKVKSILRSNITKFSENDLLFNNQKPSIPKRVSRKSLNEKKMNFGNNTVDDLKEVNKLKKENKDLKMKIHNLENKIKHQRL